MLEKFKSLCCCLRLTQLGIWMWISHFLTHHLYYFSTTSKRFEAFISHLILIIRLLIGIYFNGLLHFPSNKLPIVFSHLNNNKAIKSHLLCAYFFSSSFFLVLSMYILLSSRISFHVVAFERLYLYHTIWSDWPLSLSLSHRLSHISIYLSIFLFINSMHS